MMATAQSLPYQNASLSAGERADDLLGRLTLEEKVSLMMDTSPAIPVSMVERSPAWHRAQWFCHRLSHHHGHGSLMG